MMSRLFKGMVGLGFVTFGSFSSVALAEVFNEQSDQSHFAQLAQQFQDQDSSEEAIPVVAELLGWNTGRCYSDLQPDFAHAGLLAANEVEVPERDNGPGFPSTRKVLKLAFLTASAQTPSTYFDTLNREQAKQVDHMLLHQYPLFTEATKVHNMLYTHYTKHHYDMGVRKANDYFVVQISRRGVLGANRVFVMCYYFAKTRISN